MKAPKNLNRLLSILLYSIMLVGLLTTTAFAEGTTTIEVGNSEELSDAINLINANTDTNNKYIINLIDDIETSGFTAQSPCKVNILGNGHTLTVERYGSITIEKGAQLNLGSNDGNVLKICSVSEVSNDVPGMLYVQGVCNMYPGVTLSGRVGNNYFGGAATVEGGKFHMYGGTIENCGIRGGSVCYGGGVAAIYGGTFIMDSGEIKNCFAESDYIDYYDPSRCYTAMGGGVFVSGGSSLVMNGGTVSNNNATNMGGGIAVVSAYEEVASSLGNIKSSAEILGGTIKNNNAKTGAGVFASAYYYAYAGGICAPNPTVGSSAKQGLYIKNAQILDNIADTADGYGGGIFVSMLRSPAVASIEDSTIQRNKAAMGGGVASYGYWTNMSIDKSTITENAATNKGGGFLAVDNTSGGKTTIKDTVLCNNLADVAASDVYLNKAPSTLLPADSMNSHYHGKPDEVYKNKIDGWYIDTVDSRYITQDKDTRIQYTGYADIAGTGEVSLIAAVGQPQAKITFTNEDGSEVYSEEWYPLGTPAEEITLPAAEKASDDKYDYFFESWSPEIGDVTQDAVYTANFYKVFKAFTVKYEFSSVSSGRELPGEVMALLPEDSTNYSVNQNIEAKVPAKTTVEVKGGKWMFKGFDKDSITANMENANDTGSVKFVGYWEFVAEDVPSNPTEPTDPTKPTDTTKPSETNSDIGVTSPQTGDNSHLVLWIALLAVGVFGIVGITVYSRGKRER